MKKTLLGASALAVIAGPGAAPALADGHVSVGGNAVAGFFFIDSDRPDTGNTSVKFLGEIHFTAEARLDNGLTAGAHVELEAQTQDDQIDEHYVFIKGGFGRLVLGADDGAANTMHYGLTGFVAGNGVDSPNFIAAALPVRTLTGTNVGLSGDANKVTYYTPRVAGVQFGVSYAPTSTHGGGSSSSGGTNVVSTAGNDKVDDVVSIGVNYEYDVQRDLKVALSGGYETGSGAGTRKDPDLWVFGGSLSAGGFTVAAAYQDREDAAGNDIDEEAWGLSGSYKVGPWQVGVGYVRGERNGGDVGVNVDGDTTLGGIPGADGGTNVIGASFDRDNEFDHIQVGGSYDMGNGISVGLGFDWYKIENRSRYNTADTASADPVIATALEEEESWALSLLLSATF